MKRHVIIDGIKLEGAEARRIIEEALWDAREAGEVRTVISYIALAVLVGIAAAGSAGVVFILVRIVGWNISTGIMLIVISIMTSVVAGVLFHPVMRPFHRREIRQAMVRQGYNLCPSCG